MCIRDSIKGIIEADTIKTAKLKLKKNGLMLTDISEKSVNACLLYTSDAADERSSVDLGGRRIITKKKNE